VSAAVGFTSEKVATLRNHLRARGRSRVHRRTHDIDSPEATIHAPAGNDGSVETAMLTIKALLQTLKDLRVGTANLVRYSQGIISRVAYETVEALFDPQNGYDPYTGTNDLAASQIAKVAGCSPRQWRRVKPVLADLGVLSFVHRSIKSGLESAPGVDVDLQISDLYWFSPDKLVPMLRELFDETLGRLKRERFAREKREGVVRRTPLKKRDKPKCRIPERLNPIGWARCVAALAKAKASPADSYAARQAEAIAFTTALARKAAEG
jgi:hypothetical protein